MKSFYIDETGYLSHPIWHFKGKMVFLRSQSKSSIEMKDLFESGKEKEKKR